MIIKNIANEIQETLKARERALARKKTKANKRVAIALEKLVKILTKLMRENG